MLGICNADNQTKELCDRFGMKIGRKKTTRQILKEATLKKKKNTLGV